MSNKNEINKVKAQVAENAKIAEIAIQATEQPKVTETTITTTTEVEKPKTVKAKTYSEYKKKYNNGFWLFFAKNNVSEVETAMKANGININDNDLRAEANKKYFGIFENALNFKFSVADNTLSATEKFFVSADKLNVEDLSQADLVKAEALLMAKMALLQAQKAKTATTQ